MPVLRFFYNLFFPLVVIVMLPGFVFRMIKRGKYRHKFGQRFGIYSPRVKAKLEPRRWTWVHAVSVGEVIIAMKLIRSLKHARPDLNVVLSTTTSTGYALANKEKSEWLEPIYNPIDYFWPVRRAINLINPEMLILVEAEVWPNLTAEIRKRGVPIVLANARLSERSEARYHMVRPLAAAVFRHLDLVCVQEPRDVRRWAALGVPEKRIVCTGSIKFDEESEGADNRRDFRPVLREWGIPDDATILLGGSTFPREEALLADVYGLLGKDHAALFLILVPRHVERCPEIAAELTKLGFRVALRKSAEPASEKPDILLVNTTGELRDWYACADIVFMGKSLYAKGGQNPAEAVAAGKPVLFGPNMQNFKTLARQLVDTGGALTIQDAPTLLSAMRRMVDDPSHRSQMAANARQCLDAHRGATARTRQAIASLPSA